MSYTYAFITFYKSPSEFEYYIAGLNGTPPHIMHRKKYAGKPTRSMYIAQTGSHGIAADEEDGLAEASVLASRGILSKNDVVACQPHEC